MVQSSSSSSSTHRSNSSASTSQSNSRRNRHRSRTQSPSGNRRRSRSRSTSPGQSSNSSGDTPPSEGNQKRPGEELTRLGRSKRQACDPLVSHGRFLARAYSPFTSPAVILDEGCNRILNECTDADASEFTDIQNRNFAAFVGAIASNPKLIAEISSSETSNERYKEIWTLLKQGQGKARTEDTRLLKLAIIDWIDWGLSSRPNRNQKAERGFNNPVILKLLAPVDLELTEENIAALRAGTAQLAEEDGTLRPFHGGDWIHLWYDGEYDSSNMMKGLLKNQLLVKAYRAIFTSPSSAEREPGSSGTSTRSGNAAIYGMTKVTPSSIAYVCAQVYFSLSSHESFSRTNSVLDLSGIYDGLMEFFESSTPAIAGYTKELLAWWNRNIFPVQRDASQGRGTMARLEAQLAAAGDS